MEEQIIQAFISHFIRPTASEWADFRACLRLDTLAKGERLITLDRPCQRLFFVFEGVARHYHFDQEQNEITTWFNQPGSLVTDYSAFTTGTPAIFEVQALTPMRCFSILNRDLERLYDQSKNWERMGRLINQSYLIQLIERNNSMLKKTARQRFEEFSQREGHLFNIVPLKYLASYLGVTLETLSRLRADTY